MKINRLEAHDRLLHFKQDQALNIFQGASDCLTKNPLSLALQERSPYIYIFAHPRTADDGVSKRMIWQPRLTRPRPQTNSYCFRAQSKTDLLEICWLLPPRETWNQYIKGKVTESEWVIWSIHQFTHKFSDLEKSLPDDLPDDWCKQIYRQVALEIDQDKKMINLYPEMPK